ncbi:hypothetical protein BVRB_4g086050 [Beta vulgaris subsp. vulgaris]|nr:hypothetical protein BVRB_4g086050 [Beta vulgaris subsp. vulgaris]
MEICKGNDEWTEIEKEAAEALLLLSVTTPAVPTDNHNNNHLLPPNNLSEHSSIGDDEIKPENTCYNDQSSSSDDDEMVDPKLVIVKTLHLTDMSKSHNRLSMPASQTKKFLTDAEEQALKNQAKIQVKLTYGLSDKEYDMFLGIWYYYRKKGFGYALNGLWSEFREDNGLKEGDTIQVVSCRSKGHLCIHINKVLSFPFPGSWKKKKIRGSNSDLKKIKKHKTC